MRRKQQQQTYRSFAARIHSDINTSLLLVFTILSLSQSTPECSCYLHTPDIHPPSWALAVSLSFLLSHCFTTSIIKSSVVRRKSLVIYSLVLWSLDYRSWVRCLFKKEHGTHAVELGSLCHESQVRLNNPHTRPHDETQDDTRFLRIQSIPSLS
jgi:hypothetical protein